MLRAVDKIVRPITPPAVNTRNTRSSALNQLINDVALEMIREGATPQSLPYAIKVDPDFDFLLYRASESGNEDTIGELIQNGAHINQQSKQDGTTPLFIASLRGHIRVVKILIEEGADVDKSDNAGFTPLCMAIFEGHIQIVKDLIQAKADVNKSLPIFIACRCGRIEIARVLIEAKANVNLTTKEGFSPLFAASRNGHRQIVQMLLQAKAEVDKASNDGATALSIARDKGHTEIVDLLLAEIEQRKSQKSTDSLIKEEKKPLPISLPLPQAPVVRLRKSYGTSLIANLTDSFERTKSSKKTADMTEKHEKVKGVFDGVLGEKKNKAIM